MFYIFKKKEGKKKLWELLIFKFLSRIIMALNFMDFLNAKTVRQKYKHQYATISHHCKIAKYRKILCFHRIHQILISVNLTDQEEYNLQYSNVRSNWQILQNRKKLTAISEQMIEENQTKENQIQIIVINIASRMKIMGLMMTHNR